eukprot:CAMPEP_0118912054 /NCGR_PEP_ID=MMETSP1166-20130328/13475_1 /TAXON_ID=1104430 /ORGANISM="Chrysoreinhardia sp, Strain CCMP3193" /LENGTH=565 /DNA_ID=CAMNT_0006851569 /DNA_START=121 /DNA_END=1814 /DNA_ORIENTATION=-
MEVESSLPWYFAHLSHDEGSDFAEEGVGSEEVVLRFVEALASKEESEVVVTMELAPAVASMRWNAHLVEALEDHGYDASTGSFPEGLSPEGKKKLYQTVRHLGFGANPAPFPKPTVSAAFVEREVPVKFENRVEMLCVVRSDDGSGRNFAKLQLLTACNYGKVYSGVVVVPAPSSSSSSSREEVVLDEYGEYEYDFNQNQNQNDRGGDREEREDRLSVEEDDDQGQGDEDESMRSSFSSSSSSSRRRRTLKKKHPKSTPRYVATSERVAIKQIDRATYERHVARRGGQLNEDPVKEVAAMQYVASRGGSDHVLPLVCCCADEESLFTVSPFCDGGDLFSLVEKHARLDNRYARHFFKQLVRGIVRLHSLGVAHHDLSLENVLWLRSGRTPGKAFIIDLGMAAKTSGPTRTRFLSRRRRSRGTAVRSDSSSSSRSSRHHHDDDYYAVPTKAGLTWPAKCGKIDYMAPELLNPTKAFDLFAVDVWALGVILYVLLIGSPPFDSSRKVPHDQLLDTDPCFAYVRERRLADLLASWRIDLDPNAIDLLERILDPEPTTRMTIPQIVAHP